MSSIVIAGDTSGTVTLQAPAVAGSTTVNLPSTPGNNGASAVVTTNASGNLGLGVTPGAWTTYRVMDVGGGQSITSYQDGATNTIGFAANALWNGSWVYRQSSVGASRYALVNNAHQWYTAPSGTAGNAISFTQAMTLNADGTFIIGGTAFTATAKAAVSTATATVYANTGTVPTGTVFNVQNTSFTDYCGSFINFTAANAGGFNSQCFIGGISNPEGSGDFGRPATMVFGRRSGGNNVETMRIDKDSRVLIGTTTAGGQLTVNRGNYYEPAIYVSIGPTTSGGGGFAYFKQTANDNGDALVSIDRGRTDYLAGLRFLTGGALDFSFGCGGVPGVGGGNSLQLRNSSGTRVFDINSSNGDVKNQNNSYGSLSDARLKENVTDATPKLDDLNKLRVVNFNLKEDPDKRKQIGLIAQEVEQVFPGLVDTEGDEKIMSVKYSVLVPMLLKAVQELNAKVEALTAELNTLKGQA